MRRYYPVSCKYYLTGAILFLLTCIAGIVLCFTVKGMLLLKILMIALGAIMSAVLYFGYYYRKACKYVAITDDELRLISGGVLVTYPDGESDYTPDRYKLKISDIKFVSRTLVPIKKITPHVCGFVLYKDTYFYTFGTSDGKSYSLPLPYGKAAEKDIINTLYFAGAVIDKSIRA